LDLVAKGLGNGNIAERLRISDKTVRNHVTNIFWKLGVSTRAEVIVRARDAGFGVDESPARDAGPRKPAPLAKSRQCPGTRASCEQRPIRVGCARRTYRHAQSPAA
jgi:hypothetical protein